MVVTPEQFPYSKLYTWPRQHAPRGNQGGRPLKRRYKDVICAFDIETSKIYIEDRPHAFCYIWQFQFGKDITVIGRTLEDFITFLLKLKRKLSGSWLCIFVHNLSYEFSYLKGLYAFEPDEVFCTDRRKILKCTMFDAFEFRCSYLHSNMTLRKFLEQMGVEHQKTELDYNITRYPWAPLNAQELEYCINDVRGLVEALYIECERDGDNLYTLPLTSTGYIRRMTKNAMQNYSHEHLAEMQPDPEVYLLLVEAFRGGDVKANRYFTGDILENVKGVDRSSSYPDVICNCLFPMSKFEPWPARSIADIERYINVRKKACLFVVRITGICERHKYYGRPYIPRDKCRELHKATIDNGRVMTADSLIIAITDIDYKIIKECYEWDHIEPLGPCYTARYAKLPQPLIDTVIELYRAKTGLKGVEGQEYYYAKSKNKLNACYGMMAQKYKDLLQYLSDFYEYEGRPLEELCEKQRRKGFLCYQWGVWVTAWARLRLYEAASIVKENFVYQDTDSVKYIGEADFTEYNKKRIADSIKSGAWADDPKGVRHYMGVLEDDGSYKKFKTLGVKKYAYEDAKGLHTTIAGVDKKKGGPELGSLDNFEPGFIFRDAGGLQAVYNDGVDLNISIDGHNLHITDSCVLLDREYTLGITQEYSILLRSIAEELKKPAGIENIKKLFTRKGAKNEQC